MVFYNLEKKKREMIITFIFIHVWREIEAHKDRDKESNRETEEKETQRETEIENATEKMIKRSIPREGTFFLFHKSSN